MSPAKSLIISGFFATQTAIFLCTKMQMWNRRFPFVDRLELPKSKYPIHRQIESKNLSAFFIVIKKEKTDMLQKELAKRLKARYDTKMDGNEWMEVSSDGDSVFWGDYSPNYEYVKEAFAVRSGLVSKCRLFSENRIGST